MVAFIGLGIGVVWAGKLALQRLFGHIPVLNRSSFAANYLPTIIMLFVLFGGFACLCLWVGQSKHVQRFQRRKGQCLECGYPLIGNTTGVCPECGTAIPSDSANVKP
jgi:hypothetical protein